VAAGLTLLHWKLRPVWYHGLVSVELSTGAGALIVNIFGKHEAEGRGFRAVITLTLSMHIPVIVGINA
jgi:hypothetical protein